MPLDAISQTERIGGLIIRDVVAFSEIRNKIAFPVVFQEPVIYDLGKIPVGIVRLG